MRGKIKGKLGHHWANIPLSKDVYINYLWLLPACASKQGKVIDLGVHIVIYVCVCVCVCPEIYYLVK